MPEEPLDKPDIVDADFSEVSDDRKTFRYLSDFPLPTAPTSKTFIVLRNTIFLLALIGILYLLIDDHIKKLPPSPQEIEARKELDRQIKIDQRANELKYEAEFTKNHADIPIIAMVMMPNGNLVTGRIQFFPNCPKHNWCAQPDGRVLDDEGENPLADEAAAEEDYYDRIGR